MNKQLKATDLKRFKKKLERPKKEIVLVLENIQYARNVASIFRTADAVKLSHIYLTGSSKTPPFGKDLKKVSRQKELSVKWTGGLTTGKVIQKLKKSGYVIVALEITNNSISILDFIKNNIKTKKIALIVGSEVNGLNKSTLEKIEDTTFIPMYGKGASLNVSSATAVALYFLLIG